MDPTVWAACGVLTQRENGRTKRPRPNFHFREDSGAQNEWRKGGRPAATVRIPKNLVFQEEKFYLAVAQQHQTHVGVFEIEKSGSSSSAISFGIWGESAAATRTQQEIVALISEWQQPQKAHRAAAFAKLASLNDIQHRRAEKEWRKEVKRQKYRMHPRPDAHFGAIGTFNWPLDEYRADEVLGPNYEALDPIRMDCSAYIVHHPDRSAFRIMGKAEDVQEGLIRMRKVYFQIVAKTIAPVRRYFLHRTKDAQLPERVVMREYERPLLVSGKQARELSPGCTVRGVDYGTGEEAKYTSNEVRVRALLLATLPKLHYHRASLTLRIRLGTFLATLFKQPRDGTYALEEYESMIEASQFKGEVTVELGDKEIEQTALKILQSADGFLVPQSALNHDLKKVRPVYSVVFTFANEAGDLRLTIFWEEVVDEESQLAEFEVMSKKWTRIDRDETSTASVVDVSLKDLTSGFAWQFDLHAAQPIDESRLPSALIEFAHTVKIDVRAARKEPFASMFVSYRPYQGCLKSMRQSIHYGFGIGGSGYTVELSRFQERFYSPKKTSPPGSGDGLMIYEPRWSLEVYSTDWDKMFTRNERLPVGERAEWDDSADTWFPQDIGKDEDESKKKDGFMQLMDKLRRIAQLVSDAKEQDLIDGFGRDVRRLIYNEELQHATNRRSVIAWSDFIPA